MNNKKSIDELIESIFILVNEAKNKSIQLNVSKNSNYQLKKAHEISQNLVELPEILNESEKNNVLTEKNTFGEKIYEKSKKTINKNDDLIHQSNVGDWSKIKFKSSPSHYYKSIQETKITDEFIDDKIEEVFLKEMKKWLGRRPKLIKNQISILTEEFFKKNITKI